MMFTHTKREKSAFHEFMLPSWQIFIFILVINLMVVFLADQLIYTREFYFSLLSDQMEINRIDHLLKIVKKYSGLNLLLIPFFLLIKFILSGLFLQLILLLQLIEINFNRLFRIVMQSSLVITAGQVLHLILIYLSPLAKINRHLLNIKPLSLAEFVEAGVYPQSSLQVLNQCNLFEILWIACTYFGLVRTKQIKKENAFTAVLCLWGGILFVHWAVYFMMEKL